MNDSDPIPASKIGLVALIVLMALYITMFFMNSSTKEPEQEGIVVHLILFFKLNFSNISPIL